MARRSGTSSMTMTRPAPCFQADRIAICPTGPAPQIATVSPASICAFSAAIQPVGRMSDRNSTCSSSRSSGTAMGPTSAIGHAQVFRLPARIAAQHVRIAEQPRGECPITAAACSALRFERSQSENSCFWQKKHWPQAMLKGTTTRSPLRNLLCAPPVSTTSPIVSWPSTSPDCMVGMQPSIRCRSEPQIAQAVTLMMMSSGSSMVGSSTLS